MYVVYKYNIMNINTSCTRLEAATFAANNVWVNFTNFCRVWEVITKSVKCRSGIYQRAKTKFVNAGQLAVSKCRGNMLDTFEDWRQARFFCSASSHIWTYICMNTCICNMISWGHSINANCHKLLLKIAWHVLTVVNLKQVSRQSISLKWTRKCANAYICTHVRRQRTWQKQHTHNIHM